MTQTTEEVKKDGVDVKKVSRRGVAGARGTTRLKFSHDCAKQNGLFLGHLESVDTSMIRIGEDKTGMPSFNGLDIPKIVFTFASNDDDSAKRRYITLQFTAVESNAYTIPGGKDEWKVNSVFDWMKHILNTYLFKGREMTDEEAANLSLSYEDFDEQGEYVPVEPEEVISSWKTLFENVAYMLNHGKEDQAVYKTKDGKFISIWMKLIRFVKSRNKGWSPVNNGDLSFPAFVGEGCIEVYKQNVVPSIRLDVIKETIHPMEIKKAQAPNMPMNGSMMNSMGGVPVGDPMMNNGFDASVAAGEDLPF